MTIAAALVEKCMWWLIFLVSCMLFYVDIIAVVAENRIISIIIHTIF